MADNKAREVDTDTAPDTEIVDAQGFRHTDHPASPFTLAIDVGGSGLKASVLDASGAMVADRVRIPTSYPCGPGKLVDNLAHLVEPLPAYDRVALGFPGMVRGGHVLTAPHFSTESGPGSPIDPALVEEWHAFALADALAERFGKPTKVANDADLQGAAVVRGQGLELVVTLGTGFGTALFYDGRLLPHMEFAHYPYHKGETYNERIGEVARKEIGEERWNKRVRHALETLRNLMFFDHCYIGGGNAKKLTGDLGEDETVIDNTAGILGGIKLFEENTGHLGL
jgi:polyphosphate glucokinase